MKFRFLAPLSLVALSAFGRADFSYYYDQSSWESAVSYTDTTLDFTDLPTGTTVTNQYAGRGMVVDGAYAGIGDGAACHDSGSLAVPYGTTIRFTAPTTAFGILFPGEAAFQLYKNEVPVGDYMGFVGAGTGFFLGITSTDTFDRVDLIDPSGVYGITIDDMQYVQSVPEPTSLAALGFGGLLVIGKGRRKKK